MQKLIDGLTKQLFMYESLFEKTSAEKEAFNKKDNELFMSLLSERLRLMNDISELEEELRPLSNKWIEDKDSFSEEFNKKVTELVSKIKGLMDKILELEDSIIEMKVKEQKEVIAVPKGKAISKYKKA
jgi:hypothetical protein